MNTTEKELRKPLKHSLKVISLFLLLLLATESCKQLSQMNRLQVCEFSVKSIENSKLAGVSVQNISNVADLGVLEMGKLAMAYAAGKLPLDFTLNLDIENPGDKPAGLNKMDWIILMEDKEISRGTTSEKITIQGKQTQTLPLKVRLNITEIIDSESLTGAFRIVSEYLGLGAGETKLKIKVKPYFQIGEKELPAPAYITVKRKI